MSPRILKAFFFAAILSILFTAALQAFPGITHEDERQEQRQDEQDEKRLSEAQDDTADPSSSRSRSSEFPNIGDHDHEDSRGDASTVAEQENIAMDPVHLYNKKMLTLESFHEIAQANPDARIAVEENENTGCTVRAISKMPGSSSEIALLTPQEAEENKRTSALLSHLLKEKFQNYVPSWACDQGAVDGQADTPLLDGRKIALEIDHAQAQASTWKEVSHYAPDHPQASTWKEVSDHTPDQERFLTLLEMTQGEGLIQGEFSEGEDAYTMRSFPAREFLSLAEQFQHPDVTFAREYKFRDVVAALPVAMSVLTEELKKESNPLSEKIKELEKKASADTTSYLLEQKLEQKLKFLEEKIVALEKQCAINVNDDFCQTVEDIDQHTALFEQTLAALEKGNYEQAGELQKAGLASEKDPRLLSADFKKHVTELHGEVKEALKNGDYKEALFLTKQGKAFCESREQALDLENIFFKMVEDINQSLTHFDKAVEAIEQNKWRQADAFQLQGMAFALRAQALVQNRLDVVQNCNEVIRSGDQALKVLKKEKVGFAQFSVMFQKGAARLLATQEEMEESRPAIIQDCRKAERLNNEAFEVLERDGSNRISGMLRHLAQSFYGRAREAAGRNRPPIIQGFEKAATFCNQALEALKKGTRQSRYRNEVPSSSYLYPQAYAFSEQMREAVGKNRPDIIQGFEETLTLCDQAVVASKDGENERCYLLLSNAGALMAQTQEAAVKNRPDIIQGFEEAMNVSKSEDLERIGRGGMMCLTAQTRALTGKTREASEKNRPHVIQKFEKAVTLFAQALERLREGDDWKSLFLYDQGAALMQQAQEE